MGRSVPSEGVSFDVARVRGLVPALGDGWAHLDGPTGMQVPEQVATAVSSALRAPVSRPGGVYPASKRGGAIVEAARRAIADLVGADPKGVVLGPGPAALIERLADALGADWALGDEVVVSRLDDLANVAPWERAAHRAGGRLRTAEIDVETCELPSWQFDELLGERTRVVAVTAACPAIGTRTEVAAIARKVHALPHRGTGIEPLIVVERAPPRRTCRWTSRRWAPTSWCSRPRPGAGRPWARWCSARPTCSTACPRPRSTPPPADRSASRWATPRGPCSPGSSRRSTTSPTSTTPPTARAATACSPR